jgi:hypothetical protein
MAAGGSQNIEQEGGSILDKSKKDTKECIILDRRTAKHRIGRWHIVGFKNS